MQNLGRWLFAFGFAMFGAAAFVAVLLYAYDRGSQRPETGVPPLLTAEPGPTKRRPDQPGGLEIPHQDMLVFDQLDPAAQGPRVERLLPPPEEPLPRPVAMPSLPGPAPMPLIPDLAEPPIASEPSLAGSPPASPPPTTADIGALVEQLGRTETTVVPPVVQPEPSPADPRPPERPSAQPPETGAFGIQVASMRSDEAALQEWRRLQRRYPDPLRGLTLDVRVADLGERGIYYRVIGGSVSRERAGEICAALQAQNVGCRVVSP